MRNDMEKAIRVPLEVKMIPEERDSAFCSKNRQEIQVVKDQNHQPLPQFPEKLILTLQTEYFTNDLTMDAPLVSLFFKDVCGCANPRNMRF